MNQRVKEKNKWIDRLINFVFYGCVLALIWLLLQITTFSSFRIPTASMHPTLIKGDYVIVNKWIAGGRIFNVFNAVKNKHISIKRIPGIRRIRKNDILIFNSPVIIRKSKFPQNPKRSVRFSGKRTKRSVQKRKARNTQKAETKVL